MRTTLLSLATLFCAPFAQAQLHAGEVPVGATAQEQNIHLMLNAPFTQDSASLEFDCDNALDGMVFLLQGYPAIDAPNVAMLRMLDPLLEVCADQAPDQQRRPAYYMAGDELLCTGSNSWQPAPLLTLGDIGTFTAIGPVVLTDRYIAYRNGTATGWLQLSFDLYDDGSIDLHVGQSLSLCTSTGITATNAPALITITAQGDVLRVASGYSLRGIDVVDVQGRIVSQHAGSARELPAPTAKGSYVVRATLNDGRVTTVPFVRP